MRGARRVRQNKSSGNVTVRTPSQAFEKKLSTASDRSRLMGKTILTIAGNTPSGFNVNPSYLGTRPAAYAGLYARWRINRLIFKVVSTSGTTTGSALIGILDDTTTAADVPTTFTGVLALRCSSSFCVTSTPIYTYSPISTSNELEWRPLRSSPKWFYTTLEGSSSDPRLEVPCSVWTASSTGAVSSQVEIDYDISYEGAVDLAS
jgi:hypothetical protein